MPEVRFHVRWPDGSGRACYSPSTVIHDFLTAGEAMPIAEFVAKVRAGLEAASNRVEERYGRPCSIAAREIAEIERVARHQVPDGAVTIETIG